MDNERWAATMSRDKAFDGTFVYCVKSTKIYCRPTCAARLARRANVHFCDTAQEAEAAGFRPCKRCKPELSTYSPQDDKVQQACDTICRASLGPDNPRLDDLAKEAGLTKHHFHRVFKAKTGFTPRQYVQVLRSGDFDFAAPTVVNLSSVFNSDDSSPSCASDPPSGTSPDHSMNPLGQSFDYTLPETTMPLASECDTWRWLDIEFAGDPLAADINP